jgi:hypothetical protein
MLSFSVKCQNENNYYSVKNRWTVKASIAGYKTYFLEHTIFSMGGGDNFIPTRNRRMANFKIEANYGINKFIEVGIFTGFQHYEWIEDLDADLLEGQNKSFAPLFGINANFHVLPFFVKSKNCYWDLYLSTKYGGCYLPHKEVDIPEYQYSKYRHEYGIGLGVNYYFKNIIGVFVEGYIGQFFFFNKILLMTFNGYDISVPDFQESNFSIRIGITAKIFK